MNFNNANILLNIFWLGPLILLIAYLGYKKRQQRVSAFVENKALAEILTTNVSGLKRRCRDVLFIIGLLLTIVALAGPHWGSKLVARPSHSRDLLIALDCSRSMLAKDISPSRLKHAKWLIRELMDRTPGDRYGLIAFSGTAFLECPLTQDRNGLMLFLDDIDTDTIPVGGTNIEAALKTSLDAFKAAEGNHRAIILITDGDELQGDSNAILNELKERKIPIYAIGIGDPKLGSFIQIEGNKFITDKAGNRVKSKLNESSLKRLAEAVGGTYVHSTSAHDGIEHIAEKVNALIPQQQEENTVSKPIERYQIPLFIGLIFLLGRVLTGERKGKARAKVPKIGKSVVSISGLVIGIIFYNSVIFLLPSTGYAESDERASNEDPRSRNTPSEGPGPIIINPEDFAPGTMNIQPQSPQTPVPGNAKDFSGIGQEKRAMIQKSIESIQHRIEKAKDPLELGYLYYNLGVNYQLLGQKDQATTEYNKALDAQAQSKELTAVTYQNLGVLKHAEAREKLSAQPDDALQDLAEAQEYYREAMKENPKLESVPINQELALKERKLIEEFKKMQSELSNSQKKAQESTEEALEAQQEANKEQRPEEKEQKQKDAQNKTAEAQKAASELEKTARENGQENVADWLKEASDDLNDALENQENAINSLSEQENEGENEDQGEKAEELISQALRQLGGDPEKDKKTEQSDETKSDQKQDKKDEKPSDKNEQDSDPQLDTALNMGEGKEKEKQDNEEEIQDFDKLQAHRILNDLQQLEKDMKQELKETQKLNTRTKEVEQNW